MNRSRLFTLTIYASQFFFGGWFLFHGLNYWLQFYPDKSIRPGPGLIPALDQSGLLAVVKVLEIVVGVAFLADRLVPLATVVVFPITVVIAYINFMHHKVFGNTVGVIILALNALVALGHLDRYRPMLTFNAGTPDLNAVTAAITPSAHGGPRSGLEPAAHLAAIVLGVVAATLVTFATVRPH